MSGKSESGETPQSTNQFRARPVRSIVATTDFSDASTAAVRVAAQIALAHRAKLTVAHVMEPLFSSEFVREDAETHLMADVDAGMQKVLGDLDETVRTLMVDVVTRNGRPVHELISLAAERRADLLITGTHGRHGIGRMLIGSTAEKLVRRAPCSVLVVRPELRQFFVQPAVAVDFSESSESALRRGIQLCEKFNIPRLPLLHVLQIPDKYLRHELSRDDAVEQAMQDAETKGAEWIAPFDAATDVNLELQICEGFPPDVLVAEARKLGADLMIMGTHGRTDAANLLIGSVTERVLRAAPFSIFAERSDKHVMNVFHALQSLLG